MKTLADISERLRRLVQQLVHRTDGDDLSPKEIRDLKERYREHDLAQAKILQDFLSRLK